MLVCSFIILMRVSKFEEIISSSIAKLKPTLTAAEGPAFDQMINSLPKKIKQFNAEPYLFIFDTMLRKKELIQYTLTSISIMLEENYMTYSMYDRLATTLWPLMKDYSYAAVGVISKIKEPHLDFFKLYFQIHSNVALPEDILRKFKILGYNWLNRAFSFYQTELQPFSSSIYAKFYPQELPKMSNRKEEDYQITHYVSLIIDQVIIQVEQNIEGQTIKNKKGKYGFCFICHNSAEYYCKDTKVPVCGVVCKKSHLQLLAKTNSLNFQYPQEFKCQIEKMLIQNLANKHSPALSIDFLVAIYSFSQYVPVYSLSHNKVLVLPVIFQRIWMLYLSYFNKKHQLCQHIFASCLTAEPQFVRQMATEYFLTLSSDPRFFKVYWSFDRCGNFRMTDYLLRCIEEERRGQFVHSLLGTIFNSFSRSTHIYENRQNGMIRSFNHQKSLNSQVLTEIFGEQAEQKLIKLIFRNQLLINRQKLGQYLRENEDLLRLFLLRISEKKKNAPIDQMLRQIFYFINVKISDKVYRLFEILAQVYTPQEPFNDLNFFTYAYFILMLVTELNNSNIAVRPNLASVINRVHQFSAELATNHRNIIEGMYERINAFSFTQKSRGILSYYDQALIKEQPQLKHEDIVIQNYELIYEIIIVSNPDITSLYRICCLVINYPAICQSFLQLLVDKLSDEPRDSFLVQAITNIIEQQPNAAGYLWKQILQQRMSPYHVEGSENSLSFNLIINSTAMLTDGNFKQFTRQYCQIFSLTDYIQQYILLFNINRHRIALILPLLFANLQKSTNYYLKICAFKTLGVYLQESYEENLSALLFKMIKDLPVLPITEGIYLDGLLSIQFEKFKNKAQFWNIISSKCLEMKDDKKIAILQSFMKKGGNEFYESYLIKKTLNGCVQQHVSEQILLNLSKLQPYLHQIKPSLLKLFVLEQNIDIIMKYFQYFCRCNKTYEIMLSKIDLDHTWALQNIGTIQLNIRNLLFSWSLSQKEILHLSCLPRILFKLIRFRQEGVSELVEAYSNRIQISNSNDRDQQKLELCIMAITHIAIFAEEVTSYIHLAHQNAKTDNQMQLANSSLSYQILLKVLFHFHKQARSFQTNIYLRCQLRNYLRGILSRISALPSTLNSSILILKAILQLQNLINHQSETSLMNFLFQVETVVNYQSRFSTKEPVKKESLEKLSLCQSNKDALQYGELAIQTVHDYLKGKGELSVKDKGIMKRILLCILVQGFFSQQTCSFQSLNGSKLAEKVSQIFHLMK